MPKDIILATVGRCIYCGKGPGETELTAEHIVPFALGGIWVLGEATCTSCQEITKHIEQNVLRPMLGPARIRLNMRTRRPKERKKPLRTVHRSDDGIETPISVSSEELPAYLFLPLLEEPGFFAGRVPTAEMPFTNCWICSFDADRGRMYKDLDSRYGVGRHKLASLQLREFGRMLAKMAHGRTVAQLGFDNFYPFLADGILGNDDKVSTYVGSFDTIPPKDDGLFLIHSFYNTEQYGTILTVKIRFFPYLGAPVYNVVVGLPLTQCY